MIDVAVVGGGIIGTSVALRLQSEGYGVTLFDPDGGGVGAAVGSASYIASAEIFPLAHASLLLALPRMIFDALGPLVIRPLYAPRLVGWGARFLAAMRPSAYAQNTAALASLNRLALNELQELAHIAHAEELIDRSGGLLVCEHEKTLRSLEPQIEALRSHGFDAQRLSSARLHSLEPALSKKIAGAFLFPEGARCLDPARLGARLSAAAVSRGTQITREKVKGLDARRDGSWQIHARSSYAANRVVVTAGVWSGELLRPLGYRVPIETERGYHLMLPNSGVSIGRPIVFHERHFTATKLSGGLRLAGTVEFAGVKAPPDPRRSDVLYDLASPYLPGIGREGATRWMGFRPSFPDSLPAIGKAAKHKNLFYCFGHQHLGLTQAGVSATAMAALIAQRRPPIDLDPFRLERFAGIG